MKTLVLLISTAAAVVLFTGCNRSAAQSALAATPAPTPAAAYKAGRGLQLSSAATAFIGLQTADVSVGNQGVATVPAGALLRTAKGDFMFVANGGWFLRTPVTVGPADGARLAVKAGLYEGDTVVTHGVSALWLAEIQAVNGGIGCADGH